MPYMLVRRGSEWYVHKKNPDGSPGKRMSKKPMSKERAVKYRQALEINVQDAELPVQPSPVADPEPGIVYFKALPEGKWSAFYSNNFQDLTGEWFPEKGIDTFIQMIDSKQYDMPYLFFWHIPYPFGRADWVERIGHVVTAVGHYEDFGDKEIYDAFMKYFAETSDPFMVSHGFLYNAKDKVEGTYHRFLTFEISPIPVDKGVPANPLTVFKSVQEFNMLVVSDEKKAKLAEILGPEVAERFLSLAEKYSDEISTLKLRYKEGEPEEVAPVAIENSGESDKEADQPVSGEPQTPEPNDPVETVAEEPQEKALPKPEDGPAAESEDDDEDEDDAGEMDAGEDGAKKHAKKDREEGVPLVDMRALDNRFTALENEVKGLKEGISGLSNFIRLQFDDPRPASKADATRVDETDRMVAHLKEGNIGMTDPNDPLPVILPMFFGN